MRCRLFKAVIMLVLGLVVVVPVVGCAEGGDTGTQLVIGYQGDLTGPGGSAMMPIHSAMQDYLKTVEAEDPIPGLKLKIVSYDTRSDYSRVPLGYTWLKGQGAELILFPSPADIDIVSRKLEDDQIPGFGTTALEPQRDNQWAFFIFETMEVQNAACMQWIMDNWDYTEEGRNPKVGSMGWIGLSTTIGMQDGIDAFLEDNPGKFEWVGEEFAPLGTTAWAIETKALMDCDYIFIGTVGTGSASFIKEVRLRGYDKAIIGPTAPIPGYWGLIESVVAAPAELYDVYHLHNMPWCIDCSFADEWRGLMTENRSSDWVEGEIRQSGYATGPAWMTLLVEVIRNAVEEVGAENIDGSAIRDAAASINLDLTGDGWGNAWVLNDENHICCNTYKVFEWDVDEDWWVGVSDWFTM